MPPEPAVQVTGLDVRFHVDGTTVYAVNDLSLSVAAGEVLAIVGESGSGKSVTLKALMRLLDPRLTTLTGRIAVGGHDVLALDEAALSAYRGKVAALVFQEPLVALDPIFTIGTQIAETVMRHEGLGRAAADARALDMLRRVRIAVSEQRLKAYPHELSGGMRQRAMMALALACRPLVLLADEPTTALDTTVQMQILLLLRELQRDLGMAVMFVTHDLGVAVEVADRISVMYGGRIVETGPVAAIARSPRHPYTRGLFASTPSRLTRGRRLQAIPGTPPILRAPPEGCSFAPRCALVRAECRQAVPPVEAVGDGHTVRCFAARD